MASLESSRFFNTLPPAELESIQKAAREVQFKAGDLIFEQGDPGDGIYFVKEGLVNISAPLSNNENRILTKLGPGEVFGEMAVLDDNPRSARASAEQPTTVYFISRDDMLRMLAASPKLSLVFVREVTKRLRDFDRQYIQEVIQAERLTLVGRFASSIVHDLKNPLQIISMSADMAGMSRATEEARTASFTRIRRQVDRITNMVNELLEFTRGSHTSVIMMAVDYSKFSAQQLDEIRQEIMNKTVTIVVENDAPPVKIGMNPQRLSRVLHNLVHNSINAMGKDGGTIKIRFRLEDKYVVTEIEDTGPGIPPQIVTTLFKPFVTYGKAHGTGLGLSICKKIIEDHIGKIRVLQEEGRGAVFIFHLPIIGAK